MDQLYKAQEADMASRMDKIAEEAKAKQIERNEAGAKYASLNRLVSSPDFQAFLVDHLNPKVEEQRKIALDRTRSMEERDVALALADFGTMILELAEAQRDHWKNRATAQ